MGHFLHSIFLPKDKVLHRPVEVTAEFRRSAHTFQRPLLRKQTP